MPKDMADRMFEDMPDRMPEGMPDRMPDKMSDRMPEDMPDKVPECLPDRMPEDLPDDMPKDMPDRMPEDMPDRMPDKVPEGMPDKVPECLPDRMPEDLPDRMPEDLPDRMPEDTSDRMPEDMPDRMSEDLPVTKGINVMVGITRSKVFFSLKSQEKSAKTLRTRIHNALLPVRPKRGLTEPYKHTNPPRPFRTRKQGGKKEACHRTLDGTLLETGSGSFTTRSMNPLVCQLSGEKSSRKNKITGQPWKQQRAGAVVKQQ